MDLIFTILSGDLKVENQSCSFHFALVFHEKGVYYVETFLNDKDFFSDEKANYFFHLSGKTKEGYDIEIESLRFTKYENYNHKIEFECEYRLKLIDNTRDLPEKENDTNTLHQLWYIELEGLNTVFADNSEGIKYVAHEMRKLYEFDHTSCSLHFDLNVKNPGNHIQMIFFKNSSNGNVLIDFTHQKGYSYLNFDFYTEIKNELIHIISFINGANVSIRRELTGLFCTQDASKAQITYIYSFQTLKNQTYSDFVPINYHHSYSKVIFRDIFLLCFQRYIVLNKDLDLNSLVTSLNNSYKTNRLEDRFYILITALEKISNLFWKVNKKQEDSVIDTQIFEEEIKPALFKVLEEKVKGKNSNKAFYKLKSKIGGINNGKYGTNNILLDFLEYSLIPINENVINIIELRNKIVHEGYIGNDDNEKFENYLIFDNLLRDCLLNIIGYASYRRRSIEYFKINEMKHSEI